MRILLWHNFYIKVNDYFWFNNYINHVDHINERQELNKLDITEAGLG